MVIARYCKEHFVSADVVGKTDGIQAAWRNNFSLLGGRLVPKHLIISPCLSHLFSFITTSQTSCIKLVATASLHLSYPVSSVVCRESETRTGSYNRPFGELNKGGGVEICVCSQTSGVEYEQWDSCQERSSSSLMNLDDGALPSSPFSQ